MHATTLMPWCAEDPSAGRQQRAVTHYCTGWLTGFPTVDCHHYHYIRSYISYNGGNMRIVQMVTQMSYNSLYIPSLIKSWIVHDSWWFQTTLKVLKKGEKTTQQVHRSPKLFTLLPLPPPPKKKKNIRGTYICVCLIYIYNIYQYDIWYCFILKIVISFNWRSLTTFVTHSTMFGGKRRTIIHWQTLSSSLDSPVGNNNQNSLTTPYEHQSFSRKGQSDDILQVISSDCFLNSNDNSKSTAPF